MDSRLYWIWLQEALGCGSPYVAALLSAFTTPEGVWCADEKDYRALGLPQRIVKRLSQKSMDHARGVLMRTFADGDWLLTPADENYPSLLRGIYSPPLVLYGQGMLPDLSICPVVGMVGTRRLTEYGRYMSAGLTRGLARGGAVVVTGCAQGGDEAIVNGVLDAGGFVVSVLATGLDVNYPAATANMRRRILEECAGALVTEYPYGERVKGGTFHIRNRIISGMSLGVCVVEAPAQSGTLITATHAREQGRDVFAVPGDVRSGNSEGANELIKHGAKLVQSAADILEEYAARYPDAPIRPQREEREESVAPVKNATTPAALPQTASAHAQMVYAALTETPRPADEIAAAADVPMSVVFAALTELELLGFAIAAAGQQYRRP